MEVGAGTERRSLGPVPVETSSVRYSLERKIYTDREALERLATKAGFELVQLNYH